MAFFKACVVSLAISSVWFVLEYAQFGELQGDRECDNIVFVLYLMALWYAFSRKSKDNTN